MATAAQRRANLPVAVLFRGIRIFIYTALTVLVILGFRNANGYRVPDKDNISVHCDMREEYRGLDGVMDQASRIIVQFERIINHGGK